jgi:hypothetical protein
MADRTPFVYRSSMRIRLVACLLALAAVTGTSRAEVSVPSPPPPGPSAIPQPPSPHPYQPYGPPPGAYPGAPYGYPPSAYAPSAKPTPYRTGDPIPPGYHVEDKPRKGLVTAGIILTAVPYAMGLMAAAASEFGNQSVYLAVPYMGPWLTLGRRTSGCNRNADGSTDGLRCVGDIFTVMGLIIDGIAQATGGTLLLVGVLATKPQLVADDQAVRIAPTQIGSGYGLRLHGSF